MKIMLDPGHGGKDPGAIGSLDGTPLNEKDLNLAVALKLRDKLRASGHMVFMTRETDSFPSLSDRTALENSLKPDCFVSIHCNSDPQGQGRGYEIEYLSESGKGLAEAVLQELKALPLHCRGLFSRPELFVLRFTKGPAILVECGFVSCKDDLAWLTQSLNQASVANAISKALTTWGAT